MSGLMTHDLEGHEFEVWDGDCMMVVKEIVNRFLEEVEVSLFWEEGGDFRVDVLLFHTCLTDILGFLEKLKWWFEQDIDDREEENEEGEMEEDAKDGSTKQGNDNL
nr:hypothetical protein [Tanacetum cinerariifolium]